MAFDQEKARAWLRSKQALSTCNCGAKQWRIDNELVCNDGSVVPGKQMVLVMVSCGNCARAHPFVAQPMGVI